MYVLVIGAYQGVTELFQQFSFFIALQYLHLLNGDSIELYKPFTLRHLLVDECGIEILHIAQSDQLVDGSIVTDIAFQIGILFTPHLRGSAEHGNVQYVGFIGIDDVRLLRGHFGGNQVLFDSVGMDAVIDLEQFAFGTPAELRLFLLFQSPKFLDGVQLGLYGNPARKLERNILIDIGSAVTTLFGNDTDCVRVINPFLRRQGKGIQTGLLSKPLEFEGFEIRIVQTLPNFEMLDCVSVSQPVANHCIRIIAFMSHYVRRAYIDHLALHAVINVSVTGESSVCLFEQDARPQTRHDHSNLCESYGKYDRRGNKPSQRPNCRQILAVNR